MKKLICIITCLAALLSCGSREKSSETVEFESMNWENVTPESLDINPFQTIGQDWMALAMGRDENMNSMTISWGTAGVLWNKPVFTVFVSSDRYSKGLMDEQKYFTVMAFPESKNNKDGLTYIGSRSGRDEPNKTENAGFTVEYTELGNPMFKEAELVFECKIWYKEEFKQDLLPSDVKPRYDTMGLHTMYIGEIVNVYRHSL